MKRYLALFAALTLLAGCSQPSELPVEPPPPVPGGDPAVVAYSPTNMEYPSSEDSPSEPETLARNLLTGEDTLRPEAAGRRPVAVMVSNIRRALPQYGIGSADLWYETLVEGGITRIMALFADGEQMPRIGPVRSARDYYLDLAAPLNAVYVHIGGSTIADAAIKARKLDDVDGKIYTLQYFTKDQAIAAAKGQEHSFFTSGGQIAKAVQDRLTTFVGETAPPFLFSETPRVLSGPGSEITIAFSGSTISRFLYRAELGRYQKEEFGAPHIDAATGKAIEADNVIVLHAPVSLALGHSGGLLAQDYQKGGKGYYFSKGGGEAITWTKGGYQDSLSLFSQDGEPLALNTGKTYISILPDNVPGNLSVQ